MPSRWRKNPGREAINVGKIRGEQVDARIRSGRDTGAEDCGIDRSWRGDDDETQGRCRRCFFTLLEYADG
jgi:hypothetical protein